RRRDRHRRRARVEPRRPRPRSATPLATGVHSPVAGLAHGSPDCTAARSRESGDAEWPVARRINSLGAVATTASRGLSLVVAYNLGKAALEVLAVIAVLVLHAAVGTDMGALSARIGRHWLHGTGAVLAHLIRLVGHAGDGRLIVVALVGDALTSAVEGIL